MSNTLSQVAKTFVLAGVSQYISAEFIEALADRIEELETENADLKAKLDELEAERQSQKDYYASRLILE